MKIGSSSIVTPSGKFDSYKAQLLVDDIIRLRKEGKEVYLVSSGAVALGRSQDPKRDRKIAAGYGQIELMLHWREWFKDRRITVCQAVIETGSSLEIDSRNGVQWIINGNDVVSKTNNDILAAVVANKIKADALFLLTDVEGYLDAKNSRIDMMDVRDIDLDKHNDSAGTSVGSGGIRTKLQAVKEAQTAISFIAKSSESAAMSRILRGEDIGTCFVR